MVLFRQVYKLILILLWFIICTICGLIIYPGGWRAVKRSSKGTRLWSKGISFIINLKINIHGDIKIVKGIVVSNHLSYVDILTLSNIFPIRFAANLKIRKWPILGTFINLSHPIWVNQKSRQSSKNTLQEYVETVEHGVNLIVFPEGKISDGLNGIQEFKSAPFEAVVCSKHPALPVLIHYRDSEITWAGSSPLQVHAWKILGKKEIVVDLHILDHINPESMDRKEMVKKVHSIMDRAYRKLYD